MLALRKLGASYLTLANHFNVPKDTIAYLCQRFGLGGKINPPIAGPRRTTSITIKVNHTEEIINPGKTYAQYLQAEKDRRWKHLTQKD